LSGKKGIGKSLLVKHFLYQYFVDENSKLLLNNNTHPNVLNIKKKDDKKNIEIDQIREIIKFTNQSSFNNKLKFIIIDDVENLNINSSNALLKSLEEPNLNVYFILIFNSEMKISDTIRSRCLEFKIDLKLKETKAIVDNYYNESIYDNLNENLKNYYTTPKFLISLITYFRKNDLSFSEIGINELIENIIDNKQYNKDSFIKEYLNYIIELFFYNHINVTKKISFKVKEYYYYKLSNIRKFNLDYETFFLEFKDKLLGE
jgi:DNA polymerase III, gamma/tau subunits